MILVYTGIYIGLSLFTNFRVPPPFKIGLSLLMGVPPHPLDDLLVQVVDMEIWSLGF